MINRHKLGLLFGSFLGLFHFVWAWLVLSGMAQTLTDWIFRLHFIEPPYTILPFNLGAAVGLILVTSATGYLSGWVLGAIWNWLREDSPARDSFSSARGQQPATGH